MRIATLLMIATVPLALAACGSGEKTSQPGETMTPHTGSTGSEMPMAQGQTASGEGTVTAIDEGAGTITIEHGAVPAVNWPAMAMAFQANASQRQSVAVDDKVSFEFRTTDNGGAIMSISKK